MFQHRHHTLPDDQWSPAKWNWLHSLEACWERRDEEEMITLEMGVTEGEGVEQGGLLFGTSIW